LFASELGMVEHDLRILSVVCMWLEVHHRYTNVDALVRLVEEHPHARVRAFWAAVAQWLAADRRFAKLARLHQGERIDVLPVGTDFQIARRGEDDRFAATTLRVPMGTLRRRQADVISPEALARLHPGYRNRVAMGPSWRADVWTLLELAPSTATATLARNVRCAFGTAWAAKRDFTLLHQE